MGNVLNAVYVNLQQVLKRKGTLNSDSQITALEKTAERWDFLCMQISAPNLSKYIIFSSFYQNHDSEEELIIWYHSMCVSGAVSRWGIGNS